MNISRAKRCRLYYVLLCIGLVVGHSALADTTSLPKKLSQLIVENWKQTEGLPSNSVRQITQTPDGYLWMTTPLGLVRFDGDEFFTFDAGNSSLKGENLGSVMTDHQGCLWIGSTGDGLIRYEKGVFTYFQAEEKLANEIISIEVDRQDKVWVITKAGLYHIVNNSLQRVILPNEGSLGQAVALGIGPDGNMWTYLANGILYNLASNDTIDTGVKFYFKAIRRWNSWDFIFDKKGNWWLATPDGLFHSTIEGEIETITSAEGLTSNSIRCIIKGGDGSIWLGLTEGIFRIMNDGQMEGIVTSGGIAKARIDGIYEGNDGSVWFGSYSDGLSRLIEGPFELYSENEGIDSNEVWAVVEDTEERIWIASEMGVNIIDGNSVVTIPGLQGQQIRSLCIDNQKRVWIGTNTNGIYINENGKTRPLGNLFFKNVNNNAIKVIYQDPEMMNVIWVGTQTGVVKLLDDKIDTVFNVGFINAIHRDRQGILWYTSESGLYSYHNQVTTRFSVENGLPTNRIIDLLEDDNGGLWLGSGGEGLIHMSAGNFTSYKSRDGLNTNDVWGVGKDDQGYLWLSCDEGLRRVSISSLDAYDKGLIAQIPVTKYGKKTNKSTIEFNSLGFPLKDVNKEGSIWFPSMSGAVKVNPRYEQNNDNPGLYIEKVIGKNGDYAIRPTIPIISGDRDIELKYAAVYFGNRDVIKFQCMLEGYDQQWHDVGSRTSAFYTNLPPGRFTFKVRLGENWGYQEDQISFVIEPYFYETIWFYAVVTIILLVIIYYIFKIRTRAIRLRNKQMTRAFKELEQKNAEMTRFNYTVSHDLKSPLITIKSFLGLLEEDMKSGDQKAVREDIECISGAASNMNALLDELLELSKVGLIINELESNSIGEIVNDVLNDLAGKIKAVDVVVHSNMPTVDCDRRRIKEVFQNLIENSIKFRQQEVHQIEIGFNQNNEFTYTFFVKDNGVGIEKEFLQKIFEIFERLNLETPGTGIGLALVKRIVEVHGGRVWAESQGKGKGSTFYFSLVASA